MTRILCPCIECIHSGNHYVCNAKKVELKYRNMATVNEGRVDMWVCKQYELSEYAKRIDKEFVKFFEPQEISDRNLKMWHDIYAEEKRRKGSDKE